MLRPAGELTWTKTSISGRYYPAGFTNKVEVISSLFAAAAKGRRVLDVTNAIFTVFGGNLSMATNSTLTLTTNNHALVTSTNLAKLSVTFAPATGLVSGSFTHPATLRATPFKAVVLPQQKAVYGWFLGSNQSGGISIIGE
ncbi:MAG: hypothetical protein H7X97_08040 [Opitutaceae bacterium]|nr:hypothetical protein [Verrucomicrobiales bacterium]